MTELADLSRRLHDLEAQIEVFQGSLDSQKELNRIGDTVREAVESLTRRMNRVFPEDDPEGEFYQPVTSRQWWSLEGDEREVELAWLRGWVREVYRPSFGHIAQALPECWEEHPLCLTVLDVACELHSVLWLQPVRISRDLTAQSEFMVRLLPAFRDLMVAEVRGCLHARDEAARAANASRRAKKAWGEGQSA